MPVKLMPVVTYASFTVLKWLSRRDRKNSVSLLNLKCIIYPDCNNGKKSTESVAAEDKRRSVINCFLILRMHVLILERYGNGDM